MLSRSRQSRNRNKQQNPTTAPTGNQLAAEHMFSVESFEDIFSFSRRSCDPDDNLLCEKSHSGRGHAEVFIHGFCLQVQVHSEDHHANDQKLAN